MLSGLQLWTSTSMLLAVNMAHVRTVGVWGRAPGLFAEAILDSDTAAGGSAAGNWPGLRLSVSGLKEGPPGNQAPGTFRCAHSGRIGSFLSVHGVTGPCGFQRMSSWPARSWPALRS
jgi:hypothetical protein